jgi:chaperonin GroES
MRLLARKDQVIVRPRPRGEEMRGGIILPDVEKESVQRGEVVAVGPLCRELRVGDTVLYEWYGSVRFAFEGVVYLRFAEADLLAELLDPVAEVKSVLPGVTKDKTRVVRT